MPETMSRDDALAALADALPDPAYGDRLDQQTVTVPADVVRAILDTDEGQCGAEAPASPPLTALGPCILRHGHDSAWHADGRGARWAPFGAPAEPA